jgi:hypothetical protein
MPKAGRPSFSCPAGDHFLVQFYLWHIGIKHQNRKKNLLQAWAEQSKFWWGGVVPWNCKHRSSHGLHGSATPVACSHRMRATVCTAASFSRGFRAAAGTQSSPGARWAKRGTESTRRTPARRGGRAGERADEMKYFIAKKTKLKNIPCFKEIYSVCHCQATTPLATRTCLQTGPRVWTPRSMAVSPTYFRQRQWWPVY